MTLRIKLIENLRTFRDLILYPQVSRWLRTQLRTEITLAMMQANIRGGVDVGKNSGSFALFRSVFYVGWFFFSVRRVYGKFKLAK